MQADKYHSIGNDSLIINLRENIRCLKLSYFSDRQSRSVEKFGGVIHDRSSLVLKLHYIQGPIIGIGSEPVMWC